MRTDWLTEAARSAGLGIQSPFDVPISYDWQQNSPRIGVFGFSEKGGTLVAYHSVQLASAQTGAAINSAEQSVPGDFVRSFLSADTRQLTFRAAVVTWSRKPCHNAV
jgi:hypothetical protein